VFRLMIDSPMQHFRLGFTLHAPASQNLCSMQYLVTLIVSSAAHIAGHGSSCSSIDTRLHGMIAGFVHVRHAVCLFLPQKRVGNVCYITNSLDTDRLKSASIETLFAPNWPECGIDICFEMPECTYLIKHSQAKQPERIIDCSCICILLQVPN